MAPQLNAQPDSGVARADSGPRSAIRTPAPCVLLRVVDGDTIRCVSSGLVRLIGIDSPEANQPPFGAHATAALRARLTAGDTVQLEPDVEPRDRYGRTLAYVWHRGVMLNWLMLRLGWAVVLTYPPNVQYTDDFVSAQEQARVDNRGLWRVDGFRCLPVDRRRRKC
ncbi:MAG: thermonuclease family protein [Gemmatimonadota bacterium]